MTPVSLRRDYVLRMIEQMGRVVARVREMIAGGRTVEAGQELRRIALDAGIDLPFVVVMAEESLLPMLSTGGEIDRARCALFAQILALEHRRAVAEGRAEWAHRCAARALLLFALAHEGTTPDDETAATMEELREAARTA